MKKDALYPARLWHEEENAYARCDLCAHNCRIAPGKNGICGVRHNMEGRLFTRVGRYLASVNLDPVEKKPLFHFLPGSKTFSIGSVGCNFKCAFCQNSSISQPGPVQESKLESNQEPKQGPVQGSDQDMGDCGFPLARLQAADPNGIVRAALQSGAKSISYTYNEPAIFFELMAECAALAIDAGLRNIMVSNAYFSEKAFNELRPLIQAANFDIKAFTDSFYRKHCGARLAPVLATVKRAVAAGWWVELTTLLIPGENDSEQELQDLAAFIAQELGPDIPWHVSRFHPAYRMLDKPATPLSSLERAIEAGKKAGLNFVYAGNFAGHASESTRCPACGQPALPRQGYITQNLLQKGCPQCGTPIPGVWE